MHIRHTDQVHNLRQKNRMPACVLMRKKMQRVNLIWKRRQALPRKLIIQ